MKTFCFLVCSVLLALTCPTRVAATDLPPGTPYLVLERTDLAYAGIASIGAPGAQGGGSGVLELEGVDGPVELALLYWHGIDFEDPNTGYSGGNADYDEADIVFNGQPISGTRVAGKGYNNNWGVPGSDQYSGAFYRADVTALVAGSGSYPVSGLADGAGHSASGASLIVFHDDGNEFNDVRVAHYEAMDSNCPLAPVDEWNARMTLDYSGGHAELILHVADGQAVNPDGKFRVKVYPGALPNESAEAVLQSPHTDGLQLWAGLSVPRMDFPRPNAGAGLWDIRRLDMTPTLQQPGRYFMYARENFQTDCLSLLVLQLVHSAPGQPPAIVPATHDFGDLALDATSPTQRFTFTNRQNDTIQAGTVITYHSVYAITGNSCTGTALAPGASCTVDIQCTPLTGLSPQDYQGALQIAWKDAFNKSWNSRAMMYCAGVGNAPHGRIRVEPPHAWLGAVNYGEQSATQRFTARNTGTLPVSMQAVDLYGTHASSFRLLHDGCIGLTLAPDQQCSTDVQFQPTPGSGLLPREALLFFNFTAAGPRHLPQAAILAGTAMVDYSGIFGDGFENN